MFLKNKDCQYNFNSPFIDVFKPDFMKCKLLLTLIIISNSILLNAQKAFFYGTTNSKEFTTLNFTNVGLNSYSPKNIVFETPISNKKFAASFQISEIGMYRIGDGFLGHRVFLTPGDTIQFYFEKIKPVNANSFSPTFHKMYVKGKFSGNYTFYDDINDFFGPTVKDFDQNNINPTVFKSKCELAYKKANNLLKNYHSRALVSDTFYRYANGELNAQYVLWLCRPLTYIEKQKLPANYFDRIKNLQFNEFDFLSRTDSYVTAASIYNMYFLNDFDPQMWYSNLDNEFHTAATYFSGLLRDRLMGWSLEDYKDKEFKTFDSLYQFFLKECKTERIKQEVIRDVEKYQLSEKDKPTFKWLLENSIITNVNDKSMQLANLPTSKKWVLFDCWASWCIPCKKQLPFLKEFEKKYKDSIEFVYLSLDEKAALWKKSISKNQYNKNEYLLKDGFKNSFAKYFNLTEIPRYILIEKSTNTIIYKNMPMPIHQKSFDKLLKELINKKET